jgi:gluconate kinase
LTLSLTLPSRTSIGHSLLCSSSLLRERWVEFIHLRNEPVVKTITDYLTQRKDHFVSNLILDIQPLIAAADYSSKL